MKDPVFHKFVVFSVVNDKDEVTPKIVECNNCGAVHKVTELSKSEIVVGKDSIRSSVTVEDIKLSIPENIAGVLKSYNVDLPTWEEVQFSVENGDWGKEFILTKEEVEGVTQGKILRLVSPPSNIKIESFVRDELVS
jgi:hypothetical protein